MDNRSVISAEAAWLSALDAADVDSRGRACLVGLRTSLARFESNLARIRYPVRRITTPCPAGLTERLTELQRATGLPAPPPLREVWAEVGGISLVDLDGYSHVAFWDAAGLGGFPCDGLHVDVLDGDLAKYMLDEFRDFAERDAAEQDAYPFSFTFAPDSFHKDDISGGAPYGLTPEGGWRASLTDFEWTGRFPESAPGGTLDLISYLRVALLECAGFPGLYGQPAFEPIRKQLLDGVPVF